MNEDRLREIYEHPESATPDEIRVLARDFEMVARTATDRLHVIESVGEALRRKRAADTEQRTRDAADEPHDERGPEPLREAAAAEARVPESASRDTVQRFPIYDMGHANPKLLEAGIHGDPIAARDAQIERLERLVSVIGETAHNRLVRLRELEGREPPPRRARALALTPDEVLDAIEGLEPADVEVVRRRLEAGEVAAPAEGDAGAGDRIGPRARDDRDAGGPARDDTR